MSNELQKTAGDSQQNAQQNKRLVEVFSSGGGTQSTAIAALILQSKLPRPDFTVIADTGYEMPTTWEYLDAYVRPAFVKAGMEIHRVKASEWAANWGRGIFANSGQLLMPAFSSRNGGGKLPNFCTKAWKIEVVTRWLSKVHSVRKSEFRKWIGFSRDETRRVHAMMAGAEYKAGRIRFPLVHDFPTKRHEAGKIVAEMGWPPAPRSRCYNCPNQSDLEWAEVKRDHPAEWEKAIRLDEAIRERDPSAYLHSSIKPLRDADLTEEDDLFSGGCHNGECFV